MNTLTRASIVSAVPASRRHFMRSSGALSAVAVALLAGKDVMAAGMNSDISKDVSSLNVALALEHEAINAHQVGALSGLLQKPVLDVALAFQGDHKAHRDALMATIEKMGAKPVSGMQLDAFAQSLNAASLKNQADVLSLAARQELGATNAYLGVIPAFQSTEPAKVAARLATDETMNDTVLTQALGRPLPAGALSFGA